MEPSDIVLLVLGVLCPPGSVALKRGLNRDFIICIGLTVLFWIPGIAYSWYLVFKYPLENFRQVSNNNQYYTIEDGLGRHSLNLDLGSEEEALSLNSRHPGGNLRSGSSSPTFTIVDGPDNSASSHTGKSNPPSRKSLKRGKKSRRRSSTTSRASNAHRHSSSANARSSIHEAARNYAMRHHQRERSNSIKKWFQDRFYFPDPTQVPPSLPLEEPRSPTTPASS